MVFNQWQIPQYTTETDVMTSLFYSKGKKPCKSIFLKLFIRAIYNLNSSSAKSLGSGVFLLH